MALAPGKVEISGCPDDVEVSTLEVYPKLKKDHNAGYFILIAVLAYYITLEASKLIGKCCCCCMAFAHDELHPAFDGLNVFAMSFLLPLSALLMTLAMAAFDKVAKCSGFKVKGGVIFGLALVWITALVGVTLVFFSAWGKDLFGRTFEPRAGGGGSASAEPEFAEPEAALAPASESPPKKKKKKKAKKEQEEAADGFGFTASN